MVVRDTITHTKWVKTKMARGTPKCGVLDRGTHKWIEKYQE